MSVAMNADSEKLAKTQGANTGSCATTRKAQTKIGFMSQTGFALMGKGGEVGMKKEYIVDLTEEEADELMDEHWVGELVRCKDCIEYRDWNGGKICMRLGSYHGNTKPDFFCAHGRLKLLK